MSFDPDNPFGQMTSLREAVNRLLEESYVHPSAIGSGRAMPVDVYETPDHLMVLASIPGTSPDHLQVSATGDTLTIRGNIPSEAAQREAGQRTWYLHEIPHGEFSRTIDLPVEVNPQHAKASYQNGILRLELPKAESARQHKLKIQGGVPAAQPVNIDQNPFGVG